MIAAAVAGPPVVVTALDPNPDEARAWLAEELSRSEYHESRSLLQQLIDAVTRWLDGLQDTQGGGGVSLPPVVITVVVALLLLGGAVLLARMRVTSRAPRRGAATLLGDNVRTADQLRADAATAYAERRWDDAVVASTRALARDAEERTLLPDAPAMTAHEVGAALTPVFPAHGPAIGAVMDLFDAVVYGGRRATASDAAQARDADQTLHTARPVLPAARVGTPQSAGAPTEASAAAPDDSVWLTGADR